MSMPIAFDCPKRAFSSFARRIASRRPALWSFQLLSLCSSPADAPLPPFFALAAAPAPGAAVRGRPSSSSSSSSSPASTTTRTDSDNKRGEIQVKWKRKKNKGKREEKNATAVNTETKVRSRRRLRGVAAHEIQSRPLMCLFLCRVNAFGAPSGLRKIEAGWRKDRVRRRLCGRVLDRPPPPPPRAFAAAALPPNTALCPPCGMRWSEMKEIVGRQREWAARPTPPSVGGAGLSALRPTPSPPVLAASIVTSAGGRHPGARRQSRQRRTCQRREAGWEGRMETT